MKFRRISLITEHWNGFLSLFLLALIVSTVVLQIRTANAQGSKTKWMPSGHGNLGAATEQDPSVKGFVAKHSKGEIKQQSDTGSVHVVYLVPFDKKPRHIYSVALRKAIREMRAFYQAQLGITESRARADIGETFDISSPAVEVVVTPHDSAFYNANNQAGAFEFFFRAVQDGFEATGGGFNDPDDIWVFYIDADPACGQGVGGTSGVALLPANDLRGLVGEPNVPSCIGDAPDTGGVCRWIGGLGHELGHALGLPHPPGCEQGNCSAEAFFSLMFFGYTVYPDTYFLDEDKERLRASPFFEELKVRRRTDCRGEPLN